MDREQLEQEARRRVDAVWEQPAGRLALRRSFYEAYGRGIVGVDNLGDSELAFLRWEIGRGVLDAVPRGSPWWKGVNGDFCYHSELARLAWENGAAELSWEPPVRAWLEFLRTPTPRTWYRAHNTSIVAGYLARLLEAKHEHPRERVFTNIVLYRLLFAQAMIEEVTPFPALAAILADPRWGSVDAMVHLPDFYPDSYPMTAHDFAEVMGRCLSVEDVAVHILDDVILRPHLAELYAAAAGWDACPDLTRWLSESGHPIYPHETRPPEPWPPGKRAKIAILGGGIASLAAAWELTSVPGWQDHYEITLYQLGWRCGGKMAGGRGPHGRVEELGLHLLLGFYVNAFPMFQEVYRERTARGLAPDSPYRELSQALQPNNATLLVSFDAKKGKWVNWPLVFPPSAGSPGDGPPLDTWQLLRRGMGILLEVALGSPYSDTIGPLTRWLLDHFFPPSGGEPGPSAPPSPEQHGLLHSITGTLSTLAHDVASGVARLVGLAHVDLERQLHERTAALGARPGGEAGESAPDGPHGLFGHLLYYVELIVRHLEQVAASLVDPDSDLAHLLLLFDFGLAMMKGIFADVYDPLTGKFHYRRINDQDFRAWLRKHGARDETLFSPIVTFFYTGTFEALADEQDAGGLLAAGTALQFAIPSIGYKGSFCNQLRLGTADTLILPMVQVLAARGVRFEFFQKVLNVAYTSPTRIERIELEQQVRLREGLSTYTPHIEVKKNPAWPNAPLYDQLDPVQAAELRAQRVDLESPWSAWRGERHTLELGRDFDEVILGIPARAQADACAEIIGRRTRWRLMVEKIHTAQVMSAQLWFKPDLASLGFDLGAWGMGQKDCLPNVVTYANPMFSWLDQTPIVANEAWPEDSAPRMLAMFTGILPDELEVPPYSDTQFPARMQERVRQLTWQWLMDNMGFFLPAATSRAYPTGLNPAVLRGLDANEKDLRRLYRDQYFSAAISPSDRYVIAVPGTERYRIRPDRSGFDNLYLVGDWTDYGTNIGYMEGCVVSAQTATRALLSRHGLTAARTHFIDTLADWHD